MKKEGKGMHYESEKFNDIIKGKVYCYDCKYIKKRSPGVRDSCKWYANRKDKPEEQSIVLGKPGEHKKANLCEVYKPSLFKKIKDFIGWI